MRTNRKRKIIQSGSEIETEIVTEADADAGAEAEADARRRFIKHQP